VEAREVVLNSDFISLPLKLLHNAIDKYQGQTYRFELLKEKSDTLICRCFGVFKGQITDVLKNDPEGHLLTVLDQTNATGGCSSCKHDVEKMIEEFRGEEVLFVPKKERVLGLSPAQLHLKIDEEIKPWSGSEVCEIKNNLVIIKTEDSNLKKHLGETFGDDLLFSFQS
jgi:NAD(P)H-nitrite reductase large subunit